MSSFKKLQIFLFFRTNVCQIQVKLSAAFTQIHLLKTFPTEKMVLHFITFSSSGRPKYSMQVTFYSYGAELPMEAAETASWDVANVLGLENRMKSIKIFQQCHLLAVLLYFFRTKYGDQHSQQSQDQRYATRYEIKHIRRSSSGFRRCFV